MVIQWLYHTKIVLSTTQKGPRNRTTNPLPSVKEDGSSASMNKDVVEISEMQNAECVPQTRDVQSTDPGSQPVKVKNAHEISRLLDFLKLADRILLWGCFDSVVDSIRKMIQKDRASLTAEHIRTAAETPARYGVGQGIYCQLISSTQSAGLSIRKRASRSREHCSRFTPRVHQGILSEKNGRNEIIFPRISVCHYGSTG